MAINSEQLAVFISRFFSEYPSIPNTSSTQQQVKLAIEFIEPHADSLQINLASLSSSNLDTFSQHQKQWQHACQILTKSLRAETNYLFDKSAAQLEIINIERTIDHTNLISLHDISFNLGIREKFARGRLTEQEWLTDLDLQRMLELTNTQDKVHILTFSPASIGTALHFEREKNKAVSSPWTIPFILNNGSEANGQGSHWIAASITVDPVAHSISWQITDSMALSARAKQKYTDLITKAIGYQETNPAGMTSFSAYPAKDNWTVTGNIIEQDQRDGYSCGYRALHNIFQDEALIADNELANRYRTTAPDSASLTKMVYEAQLQGMGIEPSAFDALHHKQRQLFMNDNQVKRINPRELEHFLSTPDKKVIQDTMDSQINPRVHQAIHQLDIYSTLLTFPGVADDSLRDTDFEQLFTQLESKLTVLNQKLRLVTLSPCNHTTIDGLNAFLGLNSGLSVNKIHMVIDAKTNPNRFINKLKLSLTHLADTGVTELSFDDNANHLQADHWQEVYEFIAKKGIALTITLPNNHSNSIIQRNLDDSISMNQREKQIKNLNASHQQHNALMISPSAKRSRKKIDARSGLNIDIELQQEQQVEVEIATQTSTPSHLNQDPTQAIGLTFFELEEQLQKRQLPLSSHAELISLVELKKSWHTWCGNIVQYNGLDALQIDTLAADADLTVFSNKRINRISPEACTQLLNYRHLFQGGINPDSLPDGFLIVAGTGGPSTRILHYDNKTLKNIPTIAPQITEKPRLHTLSSNICDRIITSLDPNNQRDNYLLQQWNTLQKAPYIRDNVNAFRRHLITLLHFDDKAIEELLRLCHDQGQFKADRLEYIINNYQQIDALFHGDNLSNPGNNRLAFDAINHHMPQAAETLISLAHRLAQPSKQQIIPLLPKALIHNQALQMQLGKWNKLLSFSNKQYDALFDVYAQYGEEGLAALFASWDAIDSGVFKQAYATVFHSMASFVPMINNARLQDALQTISGFSQNPTLYSWWSVLLKQHTDATGYDDLPALVDSFSLFSKKIDEYGLSFYPDIAFQNSKNMPTTLARMLDILEHCKPEDRKAQWQGISRIPLQANGAIYALTDAPPCGFVVPEMAIEPGLFHKTNGYKGSENNWKSITIEGDIAKTRQHFYHYLAWQTHRLSLSFYQDMDKKIQHSDFTKKQKTMLYALLADSTTGRVNHALIADDTAAEKNWDRMLEKLTALPMPMGLGALTGKVRNQIIKQLFNLDHVPSLPILEQLLALITACLKLEGSVFNAKKELTDKANKLNDTCNTLNFFTQQIGNSIYEGMALYDDATYAQPSESIFYRHLDTASHLVDGEHDSGLNAKDVPPLLAIMSQFNMAADSADNNRDNAFKIRLAYLNALSKNHFAIQVAFELFKSMGRGPRQLTPADLITFMQTLNSFPSDSLTTTDIQNAVKKDFEAYFPANYFQRLQAQAIPAEALELLESHFNSAEKERIMNTLKTFAHSGTSQTYSRIIESLIAITLNRSAKEQELFLNTILSPTMLENVTIDEFSQLLSTINEKNALDSFLFFIAKAEQYKHKSNNGLLQKATIYLDTVLPSMASLNSQLLSKVESLNIVIDIVLATDAAKLTAIPNIMRHDDDSYQQLEALLMPDSTADAKALDAQLQSLLTKIPALPTLTRLQNHLHEINNPIVVAPVAAAPVATTTLKAVSETIVKSVTSGFKRFFTIKPTPAKTDIALPEPVAAPIAIPTETLPEIDQSLVNQARLELQEVVEKRKQFMPVLMELFHLIHQTAEHYPGDKATILSYLRYFPEKNSTGDDPIVYAWKQVNVLHQELVALDDADMVRSLCNHFNQSSGDLRPDSLTALLSCQEYKALERQDKTFFLTLFTSLLNNNKSCLTAELIELMRQCQDETSGQILLTALKATYKSAPWPELAQFKHWQTTCPPDVSLAQHLADEYSQFDKHPCERESVNGFSLPKAREQANKMINVSYSDDELRAINEAVKNARDLSTDAIKQQLARLRSGDISLSNEELIALAAELMYRTKGMPAMLDAQGQPKFGRSFEIHTTQYLAIHSMLKSGQHVTSEIGTGEGKSRIMMLMILCQYARGQTVDFVTSDVQLATRDYLAFRSLFQAVGAKTNLIYQNTPAEYYALDGINFSDAANLSLFRNKASSDGLSEHVMVKDPAKRAMMLDEADRVYFDLADTRFNYSAQADGSIANMTWVYEVLVGFFSQDNPDILASYYDDIDACNQALMNYATAIVGADKAKCLNNMSQAQLEAWQQSALTALSLELGQDFMIAKDIETENSKGAVFTSEARLLINHREDARSKFSFGVHQCLHARLNRLKKYPDLARTGEEKLAHELRQCQHDFSIDSEKQIIYSSTSKSMLDDYQQGTLYAVTGTAGSIQEQEEARMLYGSSKSSQDMTFITVPRHRGLHRTDSPLYLAADSSAQNKVIMAQIQEARLANQPVTIICKDDIASDALFNYLQQQCPDDKQLVRLSAQTSSFSETHHIEQEAGKPGMVTISTGMIGRGTDIPLHAEAKQKGLMVLVNYLPRQREYQQIIGRAGRFGDKGEAKLILNKADLKQQLGKSSLNDGFYTATEAYIRQQHAIMDRKAQVDRLIKFIVSDFRRQLTDTYFNDFLANVIPIQRQELRSPWKKFFDETDKKWSEIWQTIQGYTENTMTPDLTLITTQLSDYQQFVESKWYDLQQKALSLPLKNSKFNKHPAADYLTSEKVRTVQLAEATKTMLSHFDINKIATLKTAVYDRYHPAHDGKAVLYTRPFEKIRAVFRGERPLFADFRAWRNNRGILFPNLRAWLNGHMSLGQLLFGGATKTSEIISVDGRSVQSQELNHSSAVISHLLMANEPKPDSHHQPQSLHNDEPEAIPLALTGLPDDTSHTTQDDNTADTGTHPTSRGI